MEIHWFCHGHTVINGKRGHMLKPSLVACEAVLWFKWKDLDLYIHFFSPCAFCYFHALAANYQKHLYHSFQTTSTSFPPWCRCKVEMPNLWHCNHFHGNRLWHRKNKIMMTSLQDQTEGETEFYAGEAFFPTQTALMTAGENTENYCQCRKRPPNLSYKCFC